MNKPARSEFFTGKSFFCFFTICSFGLVLTPLDTANASGEALQNQLSAYGQTPLSFEANRGQAKTPVQFIAQGLASSLYLTPTEAILELRNAECGMRIERTAGGRRGLANNSALQTPQSAIVKMKFVGANAQAQMHGENELPGKSNYFTNKRWTTDVPMFGRIRYAQVYPGIDLIFYGNQQQLEYDFLVQPGEIGRASCRERV